MSGKWHVSILVLLVYLAVFQFWLAVDAAGRTASTTIVVVALTAILLRGAREQYFVNRWDFLFHGCVVLDICLEGFFIPIHEGFGFYLCAAGFTVVIGGYRSVILNRSPSNRGDSIQSHQSGARAKTLNPSARAERSSK
ncbi:MAG: hypothetical protein HY735_26860 [Verrucomicrobia bacterium]|nr:hypothetical protein [Verrucomicrobiota bacterium]